MEKRINIKVGKESKNDSEVERISMKLGKIRERMNQNGKKDKYESGKG